MRVSKQKHPMNDRGQYNHLQSYYEPVGNQSCSLQFSSYDEPKVIQSSGDNGSTLGAISLFAAIKETGN